MPGLLVLRFDLPLFSPIINPSQFFHFFTYPETTTRFLHHDTVIVRCCNLGLLPFNTCRRREIGSRRSMLVRLVLQVHPLPLTACRQGNTRLDSNTWALITDCDPRTYCAPNGTCADKGCRRDIVGLILPLLWRQLLMGGSTRSDIPIMTLTSSHPYVHRASCESPWYRLRRRLIWTSCPDEADQCLTQAGPGGPCQKNRDGVMVL